MFAIVMLGKNNEIRSYAYYDPDCGHMMSRYTTPGSGLVGAKFFPTREAAQTVYDGMRKERVNEYSDGSTTPPMHIWQGLQICNDNPKDEGTFAIVELSWAVVESVHVQGELTSCKHR